MTMIKPHNRLKLTFRFLRGCFMLVSLGLFVSGFTERIKKQEEITQQINTLKSEIATYQEKNQEMSHLIDYVSTPDFIESEARLNMGLKKPGETVVLVTNKSGDDPTKVLDTVPQSDIQLTGPEKWWKYFFE